MCPYLFLEIRRPYILVLQSISLFISQQITPNIGRRCVHDHFWDPTDSFSVGYLEAVAKATHMLDAPSLSELKIYHPTYAVNYIEEERFQDAIHYYSTWSLPSLSSLMTVNMIPIPFVNPVSLRCLHIKLDYEDLHEHQGRINMRALVYFFASCVVLEELALTLSFARDISRLVLPLENRVSLNRVTELAFAFNVCHIESIKAMFDVVHFPNATSMSLSIGSTHWEHEAELVNERVHGILLSILPHSSAYPKLVDLRLELIVDLKPSEYTRPISLPFSSLAKVKHLVLTTNIPVIAPIPDGRCLPMLESLALIRCTKLERDWIALLLDRLKEQGNFQTVAIDSGRMQVDVTAKNYFR